MATATMTEKASATLVEYRTEGALAIMELNDPPANTYTHEMMRQLDEAIVRARFDKDVQVIIIRGAGNKFFSLAFSWLLGQPIKDTLCGTKVLWRDDYDLIAANRAYFGDFDPFGDFDLLPVETGLGP